jgi:PTS system mannose-specific IIC component
VSDLQPYGALLLILWGTLTALDLVSVPQGLLCRPVVAGAVAGWLAGDFQTGLRVGVLFECFALDVLPIGAVRYPDYGPATVAAVALGAGAPWEFGLGVGAVLGLVLAAIGGWSLQFVRRWNARAIQHRAAALAAGESGRSAGCSTEGYCATRSGARPSPPSVWPPPGPLPERSLWTAGPPSGSVWSPSVERFPPR